MWHQIGRLVSKILVITLPVVLVMQMFCAAFPMAYMDVEYAMYKQQKDYISKNHDNNRVLILGDSRAKASFVPDILGEDVYNLSLGGISPVESYYMLKEYLENHDAPEYLILAYGPLHLCRSEENDENFVFWKRCIYFHTFNQKDFFELAKNRNNFENNTIVDREHIYLEYAMYKSYFPNKYGAALKKAFITNRYRVNQEKYDLMVAQRGYSLFGTEGENGGLNGEAKKDDFESSDMIDYYLNAIFDICREYHIQVILEQLPMTETSYNVISDEFFEHYRNYLFDVAQKNPDIWINPNVEMYSNSLFGDIDHLNTEGATMYSNIIKERYPQIFVH